MRKGRRFQGCSQSQLPSVGKGSRFSKGCSISSPSQHHHDPYSLWDLIAAGTRAMGDS